MTQYPNAPGWKESSTSREAAETVDASTVRMAVQRALAQHGPLTTDECARLLNLSILTVRPRFSELRLQGIVDDTGQRRMNASGKRAIVWHLVAPKPSTGRLF